MTARDLITEAFQDLGILGAGDPLSATDAAIGVSKLTRLFDNWNAERLGVYASRLDTYTLTPNLNPHTIGPTGTFVISQRPVSIEGANLVLTGGINYPLNVRDDEWYRTVTIPALATAIPTDLYYSPDWPNGSIYLWTVPTVAYGLKLQTRIVLASLAIDDTVTLPPGYRDAVTLTLGEMLAAAYPPAQADTAAAQRARSRIFSNNDTTPKLITADEGMPRQTGTRATFNYRIGR